MIKRQSNNFGNDIHSKPNDNLGLEFEGNLYYENDHNLLGLDFFDILETETQQLPSFSDIEEYNKFITAKILSSPKSEIILQELEKKKLTINSLFYGEQEKANFSIMGLSVDDLFNKMNIY